MLKYLLVFFCGIWQIISGINCVSVSPDEAEPVGAVKVSYFAITEGRLSKKTQGTYLAVVSKEWAKQYKRKLNEPFEKLKLPDDRPVVKIAPDDEIRGLIDLIQQERFYSLPSTNPTRFTIDEMEGDAFRTRVLTVEINKSTHMVARENLPREQYKKFSRIRNIFLAFFTGVEDHIIQMGVKDDWHEIIKPQPPRKRRK